MHGDRIRLIMQWQTVRLIWGNAEPEQVFHTSSARNIVCSESGYFDLLFKGHSKYHNIRGIQYNLDARELQCSGFKTFVITQLNKSSRLFVTGSYYSGWDQTVGDSASNILSSICRSPSAQSSSLSLSLSRFLRLRSCFMEWYSFNLRRNWGEG